MFENPHSKALAFDEHSRGRECKNKLLTDTLSTAMALSAPCEVTWILWTKIFLKRDLGVLAPRRMGI